MSNLPVTVAFQWLEDSESGGSRLSDEPRCALCPASSPGALFLAHAIELFKEALCNLSPRSSAGFVFDMSFVAEVQL